MGDLAKTPLWRSLYLWLSAGTVAAVLALVLSSPAQSYTPLPDRSGPAGTDFQTDAPRADDSALLPSAGPDLSGSPSDDPTPPPNIPPALYRAFLAALEAEASFDYRIHPVETSDTPAGDSDSERFQANSPEFDATFDHQGLHLAPTQDGSWTLGMRLAGYGYDSHTSPVRQRDISASGNRIEFRYDDLALTEWYVNRPAGLEQGFTLGSPPPAPDPSLNADQWLSLLESPDEGVAPYPTRPLLRLDLSLSGDLTPKRSPDRDGIDFSDEDGDVVLRYTGLYVYDARDREVRAHLALSPNSFAILVDDDAAVYPVTIDPMFTSTPSDTLTLSESTQATTSKPVSDTLTIGDSVQSTTTKAVSDTLTLDESDLMATELAKLEASDATSTDEFSKDAVAISGDTAVIGVSLDDTAAGANAGSAYVFRRSAGNTWTQQAHLEASDAAAGDSFGKSVAISGDTIVVGAHLGDTAGGSNTGSAYVFTRSGGVWSEQAELEASDAVGNDFFGTSVAIDGDTVVAGASRDHTAAGSDAGSAYVFTRVTSTWSQQDKLTSTDAAASDNFGVSVAIDGDTVVAGANNDDTAGGANAGSAYVFTRSGSVWSQQDKLEAGDAAASDQFGFSVAVDGDTAVIGALADDTSAGNAAGSAYVFTRSGSVWSEQERLDAGNPAPGNLFGRSVSISGDTAVIGARWDGIGEADVFTRSGSTWTHRATLEASDEAAGHRFGYTVAVDGGTAVIGAYADDTAAGTNAGSAYVFALGSFIDPDDSLTLAEAWSLSPEDVLTLADSSQIAVAQATSDALALADVSSRDFPDNVSLTESAQLAVGLPPGDALNVAESDLMATEQTRLEASDPAVNDVFGVSVAVDGDTAVIGASNDDTVDGGTDAGSVHVFTRSGSVWTLQAQLTSTDAGTDDRFGSSVAIDGDTLVVGANRDDTAAGNTAGSAYVFTRSGSVWTQQAKLTSTDAAASDQFGQSVAIDGDTVVVGASFDDTTAGGTDAGSAYVFTRSGSVWTQQQKLEASDATSTDRFGIYVDIDGDTVVVGASGDDTAAGTDAGSAYVFTRSGSVWSEQDKLEAADAAADDSFGGIVSLSGDTALIGAAQDDTTAGTAAGSAYVFTRSGSVWSQQAKLEAADAAASDQFGSGVAVNGDIAVVGARLDDTPGSNAGSAYIFIRSGVTWSQRAKLEASDETDSDQLNRVDISGSTVVAGARLASSGGESQSGTAYVFLLGSFTLPGDSLTPADSIGLGLTPPDVLTLADSIGLGLSPADALALTDVVSQDFPDTVSLADSAQLAVGQTPGDGLAVAESDLMATELAKLEASDATSTDEFSEDAIAISGDTAVIGVPNHDTAAGANAGSAYVFVRSAGNTWTQQAKLEASDAAANDNFGKSVAISGDTVVVGAYLDDTTGGANAGSAYVFTRSDGVWSEQDKLEASDAAAVDFFGSSVAIDGDTVVAGADRDDTAAGTDAGSAYVFTRSGSVWSQQDKLEASDATSTDRFGIAVAVDGDTAVVGTYFDDTAAGTDAGSAYVFTRSGSVWSEQQKLEAADAAANDNFGFSVDVDGDTAVIGASADDTTAGGANAGSAYVFTRSGSVWSEQQRLDASTPATANLFGRSVAISGDTAVIGARWDILGEADVFTRSGSTWTHRAALEASDEASGDNFGYTVAIDGGTAVVGARLDDTAAGTDAGSAYAFVLGSFITPDDSLTSADSIGLGQGLSPGDVLTLAESAQATTSKATADSLGIGDSATLGLPLGDSITLADSINLGQGLAANDALALADSVQATTTGTTADSLGLADSVTLGLSPGDTLSVTESDLMATELQKLEASDAAANDRFGSSIAIDGDTMVVGVNRDDTGAGTDAGSAYVFTRSGSVWSQQQKLEASDAAAGDLFGVSVGISGDTVVVGASQDDTTAGGTDAGSAYVFTRSGGVWTQQQKLEASDATSTDKFGNNVAIDGDTVIVGASNDDTAAGTDAGSAYVFTRSGSVWSQQQKLEAGDAAADDLFGSSVSISGDTAVIAAAHDDTAAGTDAGSAYVFTRSGSVWSQQQKLEAGDAAASDQFGSGVAVDGDTAVVGARLEDTPASNSGSAYVFTRSGVTWSQQAKLEASEEAAGHQLNRVDISGDIVVAGARLAGPGGAAYVFTRSGSTWSPRTKLEASDGATSDVFGIHVVIDGVTVVVSASLDDTTAGTDAGSVYTFMLGSFINPDDVLTTTDAVTLGLSPTDSLAIGQSIQATTTKVAADSLGLADSVTLGLSPSDTLTVTESDLMAAELEKLEASDGAANDEFGRAVAIGGDTAVIGARFDDTAAGGTDAGSVYVFVRGAGNTWTEQAKLEASDATSTDKFGHSVAIDGDTVVVGAIDGDDGATVDTGAAYVFTRTGSTWSQQAKLNASDAGADERFGQDVDVEGETAVVSAAFDNSVGTDAGSAYVFTRSGSTWSQRTKVVAADAAAGDFFGFSIAMSGGTLVAGAYRDDTAAGVDAGSAYVITLGGFIDPADSLTLADSAIIGLSPTDTVSVSDSIQATTTKATADTLGLADSVTLALSSPAADSLGIVDSVTLGLSPNDTLTISESPILVIPRWAQLGKLLADDDAASDRFGESLAIDGDTAVIGSPFDDTAAADDAGSVYVFTRSGSVWTQQAKLEASDATSTDRFGDSVAIDGDTIVVGAFSDDTATASDGGSAYVFVRTGTSWSEQAKLEPSDAADGDRFGKSVDIDGDTVVVGSYRDDSTGGVNAGSAYVFTRSGSIWSEQDKLEASDGGANDEFGFSAAIDGDTAVVGARKDDPSGQDSGSAYVFTRSGSVWTEQQKLEASDAAAGDSFGRSAALDGDTAVLGAPDDDTATGTDAGSAYVFTRSGSVWTQQQKLEASDATSTAGFGFSVDISGDTAVAGARIDDTTAGADAGSAYVFTRSGSTWSEQVKLEASDAAAGDQLGVAVAISGINVIVGASLDHAPLSDSGSAYFFKGVLEPSDTLSLVEAADQGLPQSDSISLTDSVTLGLSPSDTLTVTESDRMATGQTKLEAFDAAAGDLFGISVAVDGNTAVIGASSDDTAAGTDAGSVYVYTRSGSVWSLQQKLEAGDAAASDGFGTSVDIDADTIVVGANLDDTTAGGNNAGSAYVFTRSGGVWSQQQKLEASDATSTDQFGQSVAIDGDSVVVGALLDDTAAGTDAGSAYVFTRSGAVWSQQDKLEASDATSTDKFGVSVAIDGDTVVVGASNDDTAAGTDAGSAYVFSRSGSVWSEQDKLEAGDAATSDFFGGSVSISGDTAVIGAQLDDTTAGTDAGSAYVFTRSGSVWSEQDKLEAVDAAASDKFGSGVAVDGDTAVVGARLDDTPVSQAGSAYVFTRSGVSWSQQAKLEASDEGESDQMDEVDISGGTVVAGARLDNTAGESNSGSAYVFLLGSFVDPADSLTLADTVQATTSKGAADSLGLADSVQATTSKAATDSLGLVDSVTLGLSPSDTLTISESPVLAIPEWAQFGKLLADDDAASDNFGWTVAIDGDTAVIGARLDDTTAGTDAGSAYVFVRSGSIWTQQAKLEADNATSSAQFGYSVAIDGDTIVVGALVGDTTTSTDSGVAYVFTRSGTTWSQQATLGASDAANGDQFGISVAVDGDTAVVGAHKDDTGAGADAGSAYVFTRDGSTWSQQAKLEASDADVGDSLGSAVTISGDTAVAGAPGDNTTAGNNAGSAYVFTRSESVWSEQAKLEAPDAAVEDSFGNAVAVDGDTAVIGVHFDDTADGANAGSAYVFTRSGVTWSQQAKLEA